MEDNKKVKRSYSKGKTDIELVGHIGFGEFVEVDKTLCRNILIVGSGSYIGESFRAYALEHYTAQLKIDTIDARSNTWKTTKYSQYDCVYHLAGIAHADIGTIKDDVKEKYYAINTDLAIESAKKAKAEGVKRFIFMSSMIIYGDSTSYSKRKIINKNTVPFPENYYGDSKFQADVAIRDLADNNFKVIVLRPPMIYGKGCKGNYPILAKIAQKIPLFPKVDNQRSILYIENLCELLCQIMLIKELKENAIVLMPQNREWMKTSVMVKQIAEIYGKKSIQMSVLKPIIYLGERIPGRVGELINKAFGNNCYAHKISRYEGIDYQKILQKESIARTECTKAFKEADNSFYKKNIGLISEKEENKVMLMLASVASMIDQFNMRNIKILHDLGYRVNVACNFENGNTCSDEQIADLKQRLINLNVDFYQIDFTRSVTNLLQNFKALKQVRKLIRENNYDFIHCHSPIGGVVGRIVGHEQGIKVIYTAHGFHFFNGAPRVNWMIYYPIEKFFSRWTDVLITINKEDYKRSIKSFHAKKIVYIPGIGIDLEKFSNCSKNHIREELGILKEAILFLSVGELNSNKNHESVIKAFAEIPGIKNGNIYYIIVGEGERRKELQKLIKEKKLENRIFLLGFRADVAQIYDSANIYILPSFREGLNVSLMEAMSSGLPCICGNIRGNVDLIDEMGGELFVPNSVKDIKEKILKILSYSKEELRNMGNYNLQKIRKFDKKIVEDSLKDIYEKIPENWGGGNEIKYIGAEHIIRMIQRNALRISLGCKDDEWMLLSVGEISKRKNHQIVIRALAEVKQELKIKFKYFIVGNGILKDQLQKLANDLKIQENIRLLGYRMDVKELLDAADLFIFPSIQEGLPVALMEAMASRVPCICSNIRGNEDLIDDNSYTFLPRNKSDTSRVLKNILRLITSNQYNIIVETNCSRIKRKFCSDKIDEEMFEIYRKIISN